MNRLAVLAASDGLFGKDCLPFEVVSNRGSSQQEEHREGEGLQSRRRLVDYDRDYRHEDRKQQDLLALMRTC